MKTFFAFVISIIFISCSKTRADDGFVNIVYILKTDTIGFSSVYVDVYDRSADIIISRPSDWHIDHPGKYIQKVRLKKGSRAHIAAVHPVSNRFHVYIEDDLGNILDYGHLLYQFGPEGSSVISSSYYYTH